MYLCMSTWYYTWYLVHIEAEHNCPRYVLVPGTITCSTTIQHMNIRKCIATILLVSTTVSKGQESCMDYNITMGETLEADCESLCSPDSFETFDYAAPNEEAADVIDRTTVCRCSSGGNVTFECFDVYPGVWEIGGEVKECEEFNITSGTTCQDFCLDIDPVAYTFNYEGSSENINCYCASPPIQICGSSAASKVAALKFVFLCGVALISTFVTIM